MASSSGHSSQDMLPISPRERKPGSASRRINIPEPGQQTFLAEASSDSDQDGVHQDDISEADSQDPLRETGEGSRLTKKADEVTSASEGSVKVNVQRGSLPIERSADLSSYEKSTDSRDDKRSRRTTFPLQVKELGGKGHLKLDSDDSELQQTIRKRLRREFGVGGEEKRPRFSDLVFTPRSTVFDRHNSERASYRGLYTLFWLGIFFMVVKIGARNWHIYGSILGGNEILTSMLQRDLLVLGLTDGVLCASTTFALLLQKFILSEYLSWDRQGWIIQNVSCHISIRLGYSAFFIVIFWSSNQSSVGNCTLC